MDFDELDEVAEEEAFRRQAALQQDEKWQHFVQHRNAEADRRQEAEARRIKQDKEWQLKGLEFLKIRDGLYLGSHADEGVKLSKEIAKKCSALEQESSEEGESVKETQEDDDEVADDVEEEEDDGEPEKEEASIPLKQDLHSQACQEDHQRPPGQAGSECLTLANTADRLADARDAMLRRQEERRRRRQANAGSADGEQEQPADALTARLWRMMSCAEESGRRARKFQARGGGSEGEEGEEGEGTATLCLEDAPAEPQSDTDSVPDLLQLVRTVDREEREEQELEAVQAYLPDLETQGNLTRQLEEDDSNPWLEQSLRPFKDTCPEADLRTVMESHAEAVRLTMPLQEVEEGRTETIHRRHQELREAHAQSAKAEAERRTRRNVPLGKRRGVGLPPENRKLGVDASSRASGSSDPYFAAAALISGQQWQGFLGSSSPGSGSAFSRQGW